MAIQLGSAYGKVSLDVNGLVNAVRTGKINLQSLAQVGDAVGTALQSAGQKMTLGLTLPILALGAASVKAASDYEETKNKAVVVFGDMADAVVESSNRAASALGVSKQEYLDYASSIGAALTAGGMGIKQATELAEQAVKNFADLASFHNARVEDVAAAWQSAIRGQYEPIQKYFPFITDAYLKTYGVANGLIDKNTQNLTANQRAIILNAIALDEKLNPAINDFAETSDGLANSTRIMQAELKDALVMLGENLLPIALQVVHALNKMLEGFNNLSPGAQKAIIAFARIIAILGPLLSVLGTVISFISSLAGLAPILSGLGISFAGVAGAVGTAGTALAGFAAAAGTVLLPILLIIGALALLYFAFKNNFMGITTTAQQLWFVLKYYFAEGWKWLQTATVEGLINLGGVVVNGFKSLQDRFTAFIDWLKNTWAKVRDFLVTAFRNVNWQEVGQFVIMGIANGMLGGIPLIVAAATKAALAALNALRGTLDSHSPSRKTFLEGLNASRGFMGGIDAGMDARQLTQVFARPVQAATNSTSQAVTMNFANGVTIRQVQQMLELNNDQLLRKLNAALGGA